MATPFLKWAGGKTALLPTLLASSPSTIHRYREPFLGGGALFFALQDAGRLSTARLTDGNPDLIRTYNVVRDNAESLIDELQKLASIYLEAPDRSEVYYRIRSREPTTDVGRAARLLFLNRTCYNGLYRVNRSGRFNVPHGRYANPNICNSDQLLAASEGLQEAQIEVADFADACSDADDRDFIYFDPPYQPVSETASFTAYTSVAFDWAEQERLCAVTADLSRRGATVLISNSAHPDIRDLYRSAGFHIATVHARRAINSNAAKRGPVPELLIANHRLEDLTNPAAESILTA